MSRIIEVSRRTSDWHVSFSGDLCNWASGSTPEEALGRFAKHNAEKLGIDLSEHCSEPETFGFVLLTNLDLYNLNIVFALSPHLDNTPSGKKHSIAELKGSLKYEMTEGESYAKAIKGCFELARALGKSVQLRSHLADVPIIHDLPGATAETYLEHAMQQSEGEECNITYDEFLARHRVRRRQAFDKIVFEVQDIDASNFDRILEILEEIIQNVVEADGLIKEDELHEVAIALQSKGFSEVYEKQAPDREDREDYARFVITQFLRYMVHGIIPPEPVVHFVHGWQEKFVKV